MKRKSISNTRKDGEKKSFFSFPLVRQFVSLWIYASQTNTIQCHLILFLLVIFYYFKAHSFVLLFTRSNVCWLCTFCLLSNYKLQQSQTDIFFLLSVFVRDEIVIIVCRLLLRLSLVCFHHQKLGNWPKCYLFAERKTKCSAMNGL